MKGLMFLVLIIFLFGCQDKNIKENRVDINHKDSVIIVHDTIRELRYVGEIVTLEQLKKRSLYRVNCKFCHGEFGKGDGVKAMLREDICPYDLTKEINPDKIVYYVILNGRDLMPSYKNKLDSSKIELLVLYIKDLK